MSAITISREFGSAGDEVAAQVARALGYHLVEKELIGAVLSQYGLVEFDKEYDTLPSFWEKFDAQRAARREMMVDMLNRVVRAVARHGHVVIVGRSGFAVLGGLADVLHVRVRSPLLNRVRHIMAQQGLSADQAEQAVKEGDRVRAEFVETFYGVQWEAAGSFDLVINSGKVPVERASQWVVEAAQALETRPPDSQFTTATLLSDPILTTAVADVLKCQAVHE